MKSKQMNVKVIIIVVIFLFINLQNILSQDKNQPEKILGQSQPINAHASFVPFHDEVSALSFNLEKSDYYLSLSNSSKFQLFDNKTVIPPDFSKENFNDNGWKSIVLPYCWLSDNYKNFLNKQNSAEMNRKSSQSGCYRIKFELPIKWIDKEIFIHLSGVKSSFDFWLNGNKVAENQVCETFKEYNITKYLKTGTNTFAVKINGLDEQLFVNQDILPINGISEDIFIYAAPKISISNFYINTKFENNYNDAWISLNINILNNSLKKYIPHVISYKLYGTDNKIIANESKVLDKKINIGSEIIVDFKKLISKPKKWDTEHPDLYPLTITLSDNSDNVLHTISHKVGFREIAVKNGKLLINGSERAIKGVNRIEFNPENNFVLTRDIMEKDIKLMKQFNINAVTTSGFPNNSLWYSLCDEYGIFICDDIFVKDIDNKLNNNWLTRAKEIVERDKNHTSVVFWGYYQDSSYMDDLEQINREISKIDQSRQVMFYSEAKLFDNEWIIPSIPEKCKNGNVNYLNISNKQNSSLITSLRELTPALYELKKVNQNIKIWPLDLSKGIIILKNEFCSTNLLEFDADWIIQSEGKATMGGQIYARKVVPGDANEIQVFPNLPNLIPGKEYFLDIVFKLAHDYPWAPKGHIIATEQIKYPQFKPGNLIENKSFADIKVEEQPDIILISFANGSGDVTFDKKLGKITSWKLKYYNSFDEIFEDGLELSFSNNPYLCPEIKNYKIEWERIKNLESQVADIELLKIQKNIIQIICRKLFKDIAGITLFSVIEELSFYGNGEINISTKVLKASNVSILPSVGYKAKFVKGFNYSTWVGKGPDIAIDKNLNGNVNFYNYNVDQLWNPVSDYNSSGYRSGIRWMGISSTNTNGLYFQGDTTFNFRATHYSGNFDDPSNLCKLKKIPSTFFNFDYYVNYCYSGDYKTTNIVNNFNFQFGFRMKPFQGDVFQIKEFSKTKLPDFGKDYAVQPEINFIKQQDGSVYADIKSNEDKSEIYYTLDGTTPTKDSNIYKDLILINKTTEIKAVTVKKGKLNSFIISRNIVLEDVLEK